MVRRNSQFQQAEQNHNQNGSHLFQIADNDDALLYQLIAIYVVKTEYIVFLSELYKGAIFFDVLKTSCRILKQLEVLKKMSEKLSAIF